MQLRLSCVAPALNPARLARPPQEEGQRALLVVPASVLHNWHDELKRWLPKAGTPGAAASSLVLPKVQVLESGKDLQPLRRWHSQTGSVLVSGLRSSPPWPPPPWLDPALGAMSPAPTRRASSARLVTACCCRRACCPR